MFDFDGDGDIDDDDINKVVEKWQGNICKGDIEYDEFYDMNNDGCIEFYDVMSVMNKYYVTE